MSAGDQLHEPCIDHSRRYTGMSRRTIVLRCELRDRPRGKGQESLGAGAAVEKAA